MGCGRIAEKGCGKDPPRKGPAAVVSDWKGGLCLGDCGLTDRTAEVGASRGPISGVGVMVSPVLPEAEFKVLVGH